MTDYYHQRLQSDAYIASRQQKAALVGRILDQHFRPAGAIVDIGSGTGLIKESLSRRCGRPILGIEPDIAFVASRDNTCRASAEALPLRDRSVGLFLCNHVYEHLADPETLFAEIRRTLAAGGETYFTVGNRLQLIESHYRLPFLSWCPTWLAAAYLRVTGRGRDYASINFPTRGKLQRELQRQRLAADDLTAAVLQDNPERVTSASGRLGLALFHLMPRGVQGFLLHWFSPQWFLRLHAAGEEQPHGA